MKKVNKMTPKGMILLLIAVLSVALIAVGCSAGEGILEVLTKEEYTYVNPDESKAETDEGIVIDGVLDEAVYKNNNWLYLHNDDGGNNVDIAMTSYYGEKGMYFVYDVTESVPIYVNLSRASYMNSCIEMYFAPSTVTSLGENSLFEIDMLPTGDMVFKKSNGKGGYVNVATTDDIMAHLGTTTKGGEINTEDCYGYCLELFIPWEYMEWLGMDSDAMKDSFVYVDPAHITSNNLTGTDSSLDRYWYFYAQQQGATFSNVFQYFRFNGEGVLGTVPVKVSAGSNCTVQADPNAIPGMETTVTVKPEEGYALNSILVNGEERIGTAVYNDDGSVDLVLRPGEEGLEVSAAAEAVTGGTKTLSGKVSLKNLKADTLEGVLVTYTGPQGEKLITVDAEGNFVLEGLEQGYYVLKAEKAGYLSISRGIYLNRDIHAELALEYDMFFTQNGTSFVLDQQNEGVVQKFGGTGYIMSNPSYNRFTYEMQIRYDTELAKEADTDAFKQQRTGMRIQFSNGKYWYIDMLKEGDNYIIQYAKHSNSIFNKWSTICTLDPLQAEKYTGEEGITLKVIRDGQFAAVYLDSKLLRVEKLDYEYATCTAQLGMESWSANRGLLDIPYSISETNAVYVPGSDFYRGGNWDITGQYAGYVALAGGGDGGWLNFGEKTVNSDIALTVKDNPKVTDEPGGFRVVLKHTFNNGKTASFSVFYNENGEYVIQSMGDTVFGWKTHYVLTEDEVAKLTGDGVKLRVVRLGTEISCYLDGHEVVSGADLTVAKDKTANGITATMPSTVAIRHYGDARTWVVVPYEKTDKHTYVKINTVESEQGKIVTNKQSYLLGDTVVLSGDGAEGWYCVGMKVNGKDVALDWDGTYSFEATKTEYTAEGIYDKAAFADNENWGLLEQNQGKVMLPSGGDGGWLNFLKSYADMDLTLSVRDYVGNKTELRQVVKLTFKNGQTLALSVTYADGEYKIQSMGDTLYGWARHYSLNEKQIASYQDQDGLKLRLVRVGNEVSLYLDGVEVISGLDLTVNKKGEATGIQATDPATVSIRHYGNENVQVDIPFAITDKVTTVKLVFPEGANGGIVTNKGSYLPGDTVHMTGVGNEGYYCTGLAVDGKALTPNAAGEYSFTASKASHSVEGSFSKLIFAADNKEWNVFNQNNGKLTVPNADGDTGWVYSYRKDYQDFDFRVTLRDYKNTDGNYRAAVRLAFSNDQNIAITVTNDRDGKKATLPYEVQTMGGTMYNWKDSGYDLTEAQAAALQSENGLELRIVRVGDVADVYIGGVHAYEYVLSSGGVADLGAQIRLRFYGNTGKDVEVPFTIGTNVELVSVTCKDSENGSVSVDQKNYIKGDTATVTVKGDTGYYYTDLTVDGKDVVADAKGSYRFTAVDSHEVSASFGEGVFMDYADNVWSLANQNKGLLHIDAANNGAGWMQTKDNWNELSLTVKDYAGGTVNEYAVVGQMYFSNGKYATVRLIRNLGSSNYTLQCMNDNIFQKWTNWHTLTAEQAAKVQGEGIEFRMTRIGTTLNLYLDDVLVKKLDLTTNNSGVTANMPCVAKVRYYNSKGYDVTLPYELANPEQKVSIHVADAANGTVTTDKASYLVGDTVKLTVNPDSGYCYSALYVDGKAVLPGDDGTYSFVATKDTYEISAAFAAATWNSGKNAGNTWNTFWQNGGILKTSAANNDTGWMYTHGNGYRDVALTVQDKTPSAKDFRAAVQFEFTNGKVFRISLTNADSDELGVYKIQTMGSNNIVGNWKTPYRLNDAEVQKLRSSGMQFRVAIAGTTAQIYLDNVLVCSYDLSAGITDEMAAVAVRFYGNKDYADEVPYALGDGSNLVAVNIQDTTNGTVTTDKNSYRIGDTVKLTVNADEGYYYTGLYVNGTKVDVAKDGTYSFTATSNSYTVTCGFAEGVFKENNANWDLTEQNIGILSVPDTVTGDTGWMDTKGNWNELSITVKDYSGGTVHEYAAVGGFYFTNGKYVSIRLISFTNSGKYVLQSMGDSPFNWKTHYTLTAEQVAKVQGEGIKFTMTRRGTRLDLYLDGVAVASNLDLTGRSSGITPDMTCIARVRYYNFGYAAEMPFELGNPDQNVTVNITAGNGTVTTDKSSYLVGETVKLTVKGNDGYYYTGVTVNGNPVELDWNGNYSFKATENTYNITATFAPTVFTGDDMRHWDIFKHQVGQLRLKNHNSGHSGWIDYTGTCNDVTTVVKNYNVDSKDFTMTYMFKFSNGDTFNVRLHNTDDVSKYTIQSMKSTLFGAWKTHYTLSDAEKAAVTGDGIQYRVIVLNNAAHVYLNGVKVCEYAFTKDVSNATVTVTLRMDGNLNNDVYIPYELKNTTELP